MQPTTAGMCPEQPRHRRVCTIPTELDDGDVDMDMPIPQHHGHWSPHSPTPSTSTPTPTNTPHPAPTPSSIRSALALGLSTAGAAGTRLDGASQSYSLSPRILSTANTSDAAAARAAAESVGSGSSNGSFGDGHERVVSAHRDRYASVPRSSRRSRAPTGVTLSLSVIPDASSDDSVLATARSPPSGPSTTSPTGPFFSLGLGRAPSTSSTSVASLASSSSSVASTYRTTGGGLSSAGSFASASGLVATASQTAMSFTSLSVSSPAQGPEPELRPVPAHNVHSTTRPPGGGSVACADRDCLECACEMLTEKLDAQQKYAASLDLALKDRDRVIEEQHSVIADQRAVIATLRDELGGVTASRDSMYDKLATVQTKGYTEREQWHDMKAMLELRIADLEAQLRLAPVVPAPTGYAHDPEGRGSPPHVAIERLERIGGWVS